MKINQFVDYYEVLQISPNAHDDTIDRVFRHLAQRYHPDNQLTGDSEQFHVVVEAHNTLKDVDKRAQYDLRHQHAVAERWSLAKDITGDDGFESDEKTQERLLALLYVKCRHSVLNPGIGNLELERLLDCPREHLDFHLWYLREKGWVHRTESGLMAITAEGVDQANIDRKRLRPDRRITDQSNNEVGAETDNA